MVASSKLVLVLLLAVSTSLDAWSDTELSQRCLAGGAGVDYLVRLFDSVSVTTDVYRYDAYRIPDGTKRYMVHMRRRLSLTMGNEMRYKGYSIHLEGVYNLKSQSIYGNQMIFGCSDVQVKWGFPYAKEGQVNVLNVGWSDIQTTISNISGLIFLENNSELEGSEGVRLVSKGGACSLIHYPEDDDLTMETNPNGPLVQMDAAENCSQSQITLAWGDRLEYVYAKSYYKNETTVQFEVDYQNRILTVRLGELAPMWSKLLMKFRVNNDDNDGVGVVINDENSV